MFGWKSHDAWRAASLTATVLCMILFPLAIGVGVFFAEGKLKQNAAGGGPPAAVSSTPDLQLPNDVDDDRDDKDGKDGKRKTKRTRSGGRVGRFKDAVQKAIELHQAIETSPSRKK